MDSSRISDGELRVQILKLTIDELVVWCFAESDGVLQETESPEAATVFRGDLAVRIEDELPPDKRDAWSLAQVKYWCSTDVNEEGVRVSLPRSERRRRERDVMQKIKKAPRSAFPGVDEEITTDRQPSSQQKTIRIRLESTAEDRMTTDLAGNPLMRSDKLAEELGITEEELMEIVKDNPKDFTGEFRPGSITGDGNIEMFPVID